jgi:O-antigen biosynthesis protein
MTNKKKRVVVVVGSGRSGTSAITRGLRVLGVGLGDNLMPAATGVNDKGFWEDQDIYRLNLEIFQALDRDWHTLGALDISKLDAQKMRDFKSRARDILSLKLADIECFGIKDPQMARILPFWKEVFSDLCLDVSYVITCRSLDAVVPSLRRYTGFDDAKCIFMWFEYVLASLVHTEGEARLVVDYDLMMADPSIQLERIARRLDLEFDKSSEEFLAYRDEFLDESLRHVKRAFDVDRPELIVPPYIASLFEFLSRVATDELDVNSEEAISYVAGLAAMQLESEIQLANVLCELLNTRSSLALGRSALDSASAELETRTRALDAASDELQRRTDELVQTRKLLIERTDIAEAFSQELSARTEHHESALGLVENHAVELVGLRSALADRTRELVETRALLTQRTDTAEAFNRELQARTDDLVGVRELLVERTALAEKLDLGLHRAIERVTELEDAVRLKEQLLQDAKAELAGYFKRPFATIWHRMRRG